MPLVREPKIRASILRGFDAFASRNDLNPEELFDLAGLEFGSIGDGSNEIPLNAVARLLTLAAERSGDPCFGLRWAEAYQLEPTGVLGYLILNAGSVRKAAHSIARYLPLVLSPIDASYEEGCGNGRLVMRLPAEFEAPRAQFLSFAMAVLIIRLRKHAGENWVPIRVDVEHRELPCKESVSRIFGHNVHYNKPANVLHFREMALDRGNVDADQVLFELIRDLSERMLAEQQSGTDIVDAARNTIVARLETGAVRVRDVAETLGIGAGALQSRLAAAGTTFEEVLTSTRRSLSDRYLRDTELPLTEIAFLLGFSELSAFTRAAQRWYGTPPSQRRTVLRG